MNWKSFILGAAVGVISGYAVKEIISQKTYVSPEKVLENVKKQFNQNGPISGSWIHMVTEPFEKHQIKYQVYKGGISKSNKGVNEQFEFIADASTGTLLDVKSSTNPAL
ncbi:putative small secreted protein [Neobacillus niacini]|uniref:PepSY domain-containing protein n=1 Tax=Neobacillus niacini TaxID=86668 RepID=UPI00104B78DA|nr:PepSY domain-containing protein [Neobacillus niacini]MDR7077751.1 putative small secreted protein [Neobacillus niacini]